MEGGDGHTLKIFTAVLGLGLKGTTSEWSHSLRWWMNAIHIHFCLIGIGSIAI
ncbi:hypothetical protein M404DRAFT_440290 [Pisolithus tinctorius Marx 270]|uniref:Uncharacterized protein n=1 Tax=Pisolithus tinctorius Marx 270 TaxID=870435 RepID=A0A0C3KAX8_PISTI|nr:hypothetical protein M404DRAFT_440290 [Pisolithus tinctorius Marx 270]